MLSVLLLGSSWFSYVAYQNNITRKQYKSDLVKLSNIQYGIFSVDKWHTALAHIVAKKIDDFKLTETNQNKLESNISNFLMQILNKFEDEFHREKQKTIFGVFQSGVAYLTGTIRKLKEQVPAITKEILSYLQDDTNRNEIHVFITKKLTDYTYQTFEKTDYSDLEKIYDRYNTKNHDVLKIMLKANLDELKEQSFLYKKNLTGIFLLTSLLLLFISLESYHFILVVFIALVYLILGVFTPMIEIDARITEMSLQFLGEKITFTDQVLYYRSKSITELIQLLIKQSKYEVILVGILVLLFSVIFPILKLMFTILYSLVSSIRDSFVIRFFVFKTGKWSMADVMVLAIFMAFIGFDGVIGEQLGQVEKMTKKVEVLTTNNTSLLFGFYTFLMFVLINLIISFKLDKKNIELRNDY